MAPPLSPYTNGIMPNFGVTVPPGDALNTTDATIKGGIQPTFFADGCRFYVEASSVNGIISEILNAVNCMGLEYDPDRLDNLCLAIKAVLDSDDLGEKVAIAICNDQTAQTNIAECLAAELVSSICGNHDGAKDALIGCIVSAADDNQIIAGPDGGLYVPPSSTGIDTATMWMIRVGLGQVYLVDQGMTGVEIPPQDYNPTGPVFVKLTIADAYNTGNRLDTYATSGDPNSPEHIATARIAVPGPLFGNYIHLLNTEQSSLRPRRANENGNLQFDQMQGHAHDCGGSGDLVLYNAPFYQLVSGSEFSNVGLKNASGADCLPTAKGYGNPRFGEETRHKNVGVTAYMRVR